MKDDKKLNRKHKNTNESKPSLKTCACNEGYKVHSYSGFPQKNKITIPGLSRTIFLIFQDIYL